MGKRQTELSALAVSQIRHRGINFVDGVVSSRGLTIQVVQRQLASLEGKPHNWLRKRLRDLPSSSKFQKREGNPDGIGETTGTEIRHLNRYAPACGHRSGEHAGGVADLMPMC